MRRSNEIHPFGLVNPFVGTDRFFLLVHFKIDLDIVTLFPLTIRMLKEGLLV